MPGWLAELAQRDPAAACTIQELLSRRAIIDTSSFLDSLPQLEGSTAAPELANPVSAFSAGTRIGPYLLESELGRGGMGSVWRARRDDGTFTRTVALKLPFAEHYRREFIDRFCRERDILAALAHPAYRKTLRRRHHGRRPALPRDGIRGRRAIDAVLRRASREHCDSPCTVCAGTGCRGLRAFKPDPASRSETFEHTGHAGWQRLSAGLRHCQAAASGRVGRSRPDAVHPAHADARLCKSGADCRRATGSRQRYLLPGCAPL